MNGIYFDPGLELDEDAKQSTINKQLRKLYLDQKRRRSACEKRRRFMEKWIYICSCCVR